MSGLSLRDEIIKALAENTIEFPEQYLSIIGKDTWINLMIQNPFFYRYQSKTPSEMKAHEGILMYLASKFLKRRIALIPFFEGDLEDSFPCWNLSENSNENLGTYYLLCCTNAFHYNFFMSIFPNWKQMFQKFISCLELNLLQK